MSTKKDYVPVTFSNSLGETISNDPVFRAQAVLAASGVESSAAAPMKTEAELRAEIRAEMEQEAADAAAAEAEANQPADYSKLESAELKALAKEREVDISGLKKAQEVRDALIAADAAAAAE